MDSLHLSLTRLSRLNAVVLEQRSAESGITSSEAAVLVSLRLATPHVLAPTRLQGIVIQSPGGLTKTLGRLEAAGLIRRRTDKEDRRSLLVELTAKGRRAADRASATTAAHYDELLAGLDGEERRALARLVRNLLDHLEPATGMRSSAALGEVVATHR